MRSRPFPASLSVAALCGALLCAGAIGLGGAAALAAKYDTGASDTEIKIGNTIPYSGPASAYGVNGYAIQAYMKMVNAEGGVNGRKINLISLDDAYSPPKTVEQVRRLVEQEGVLLMFYTLGTPTNTAIQKYLNVKKVPQLFVATGASKWGNYKEFPWTMGFQPAYDAEARIYAQYILRTVPNPKIGMLYQNDDFGKDYLIGFKEGLGDKVDALIMEQTYEVTAPTVDSQIVNLKNSGANVFFNVSTPKFAAQSIRKAAEIGWRPAHFLTNVSASIGGAIRPAGLENAKGIVSSYWLKDPEDPQWAKDKAVLEWREWLKTYNPGARPEDLGNVTGYTFAQALIQVLKQCGDDLTRENIMRQAANLKDLALPMMLPGIKANTSPTDFYPVEQLQLMRFTGQFWERFGEVLGVHDK
jgi:branched-chain amino acid transport system substrate-binding protein